jgi:hypothetical protein
MFSKPRPFMFFDAPANLVRTATSMHMKKLESAQNRIPRTAAPK